jgi:hypothetical protein
MTNYYQRPLTTKQLEAYDNRSDVTYANTFNIKAPAYNSEVYDKVAKIRGARMFKHKETLRKLGNLSINNTLTVRAPLFQ